MKKLIYFISAAFLLLSCENTDEFNGSGGGEVPVVVVPDNSVQEAQDDAITGVVTAEMLNSTVFVNIKTIDGVSVNGASVTISGVTETSENGFVFFKDIALNKEYVGVKIEKEGYVGTIKNFTPSLTQNNTLTVTLFEGETKTVDGETGGELDFTSGVSLSFSESSVVNADGTDYTGDVTVRLYYHNNTDANYLESQPGALVGLDEGELSSLITEGMISVDLLDSTGAEVFVKDGTTVSVTMPADADAPEEILLWSLNEAYGIWVSTGVATKNGDVYEFEVSHFSSYNLDYKGSDTMVLNFTVTTDGEVIDGQQFYVYVNEVQRRLITTDDNGQFTLLNAPPGEYYLKPIICDGDINSETLSISQAGDYSFDVIDYLTYTAGFGELYSFSGKIRNCDDYDFARFFVDGLDNSILTDFNDNAVFNFNISTCADLMLVDNPETTILFYKDDNVIHTESFDFELNNGSSYSINSQVDIVGCDLGEEIEVDIDSELLSHVKINELGIGEFEVLTQSLADTVEGIDVCERRVSVDATDLAVFTNLRYFYACGETVSNLDKPLNLENLEELSIGSGGITDISGLSGLTNLTYLELSYNNISDISGLSSLTNLTELDLSNNPLTEEQVDELRQQLPNTVIYFEDNILVVPS